MKSDFSDKARLQHIINAIEEIDKYTKDVSKDDFLNNSMMYNATLRQLEVIGEASNRLSSEVIQNNTDIPWARIIALRNLVIHEYFGVDDITIWNIIKTNLPDLKAKLLLII